ncbi:MAG: bifunctional 5,10-methylenetetrahydrofolate dehydrogenase/5,10-methenyltetrahydrofolate cyclohydrolase [Oscillospiraceae bacterium]|nr:bifunctional 5,10-methylenetetrahydrofolate dehydrogenase/5,10-methenyltetrahydrofolate cyclohydrolase [Oscillospiraceae bacterium]
MQELRGMPVVNWMNEKLAADLALLGEKGVEPCLAVVRVGAREDDLAYERGILKRFSEKAAVRVVEMAENCSQEQLDKTIDGLNADESVHGILLFRPLLRGLSEERVKKTIRPEKDVDCMGLVNFAHVFAASGEGFPPCTPQAVMELLEFNRIDLTGKRVVIVGRSMVVGKPLAMLVLAKNATVTVCHTKTKDLAAECRNADILVACAGVAKMITRDYVHERQIVVDVGINVLDGKLCGDVDYVAVAEHVGAITPVPGGVGTITTSVLLKHTVKNAVRQLAGEA